MMKIFQENFFVYLYKIEGRKNSFLILFQSVKEKQYTHIYVLKNIYFLNFNLKSFRYKQKTLRSNTCIWIKLEIKLCNPEISTLSDDLS